MWNLKKLNSEKQSRVGLPRAWGGVGGEGGEVCQRIQTHSCKMNEFWGYNVHSIVTIVKNTVLYT